VSRGGDESQNRLVSCVKFVPIGGCRTTATEIRRDITVGEAEDKAFAIIANGSKHGDLG
jgi:hypothetical protein